MVRLNELHEKYKDKGLVVLGVSNEARSAIDGFVEQTEAAYPIVIESTDSIRSYGGSGYPTAVLIGADGRILSTDHPSEQAIEAALENVRMLPEFPKSLSSIRKAMKKDKYSDALKKLDKLLAADKLPEDEQKTGQEVADWITWFGESSFEGAEKDRDSGSVFSAYRTFTYMSKAFKGHELGTKAKDAGTAIMKDKALKLEVKAGEKLDTIRAEIASASSAKKALKCLKPLLSKKYADTKAGKEARGIADKLEEQVKK